MFEILQHTADVRLRVSAPTLEELFAEAVRGMFAILGSEIRDSRFEIRVAVDSVDLTSLLVDFLNAVLSRAHVERVAFEDVKFERLSETEVTAQLIGRAAQFTHDIKAVTYHEADVKRVNDMWETTLVFDI